MASLAPPDGPAIVVEGLRKQFDEVVALDGIDLEVEPGTVLGLLGPNGAGKTTCVRILTTILRPDGGRAAVLGVDVASAPQQVRQRIGLAGQYAAIDENLTGRENLRLIARLTHQPKAVVAARADELLERFRLSDAADRTARTYSGGMRRRLDLAAALVHRPQVLFLDEPTTGLDPSGRNDLWGVIEELSGQGTTVLLTTQYLEEADRLADQIVVIDHGRVIARGTAAELKAGLGATIVEIAIADTRAAERAGHLLEVVGPTNLNGRSVEVKVEGGGRDVLEVVRVLDREGIFPDTLLVREPTLDDVFLSLTGHKAEEVSA
ncbi:MAG TPA: ATP-binding cassette domain-containing protein [Acidimicrobiales bacterium]|jgi:ABC-2 type transport system ATP-binding protein